MISNSFKSLLMIFRLRLAFSSTIEQDFSTDNECWHTGAQLRNYHSYKMNNFKCYVNLWSNKQMTSSLEGGWIFPYRYKIEAISLRLCSIREQGLKTKPQCLIFNISFKSCNKVQLMVLESFLKSNAASLKYFLWLFVLHSRSSLWN